MIRAVTLTVIARESQTVTMLMTSRRIFRLKIHLAEIQLSCVYVFILLFSVVFCLVRAAHKFRLINCTQNEGGEEYRTYNKKKKR